MTTSSRERRDWTLLIFIVPIGVILMLVAGEIAIHLVPIWNINAGMQSELDPNNLPKQQSRLVQPVLPAILTPLGWFDTFLTPGADSGGQNIIFPPFVVFEPSATPAVTLPPPTVATTQPPSTLPVTDSPTVVVIPPTSSTQKPPDEGTPVPPTPITSTPTTPVVTPTTPVVTPTTPVVTPTTPVVTPTTPPTPTGTPSTPPIIYVSTPLPPELGVNVTPDGFTAEIWPGSYTVVNVSGYPVVVSNIPDGNYDLIFYEGLLSTDTTVIQLDQIIIGISNFTDGSYYEIFNWGNNIRDQNTNVDFADLPITNCTQECDNREIPSTNLYTTGSYGTGILIDVDTANGAPPPGTYNYLVIISPLSGAPDSAQVDAIRVTEVPIPASSIAPSSPMSSMAAQSLDTASDPPADVAPPVDNEPAPPAETDPLPSVNDQSNPSDAPVDEAPISPDTP